jgi:fructose-1,6-bisphosphatase/sedoheptulose 1,7-bisphosphatase-like protein
MESDLSLDFLRVCEQAAIACAHTMGYGGRHNSDQVAVEAMRREMDAVPMDGTIVIGEGERDKAPMLYIGDKVAAHGKNPDSYPAVDIAVDPLEGTNLCATGAPNAIAVLAASSKGGLLHAPDLYMEKLVVGPSSEHVVSLDATPTENLKAIAKGTRARRARPGRHRTRSAAAREADRRDPQRRRPHPPDRRRRLVGGYHRGGDRQRCACSDGDRRCAGRRIDRGGDAVPERRNLRAPGREQARARSAVPGDGITDFRKVYTSRDLASGQRMIFAATGVTDGTLMRGVRFFGDGIRTTSLVMQTSGVQSARKTFQASQKQKFRSL